MVFRVRLVPDEFEVPDPVHADGFRLQRLTVRDVVRDFASAIESEDYLIGDGAWGPHQTWPRGLTMERNLADLGWHETEFRKRTSFAYLAVSPDDKDYMGCVYVVPTQKLDYDAEVYYWVTRPQFEKGFLDRLGAFVSEWISTEWPFENVLFPVRKTDWSTYEQLPDGKVHESQLGLVAGDDS